MKSDFLQLSCAIDLTGMEYEIFEEPYTVAAVEDHNNKKPCEDKFCAFNLSAERHLIAIQKTCKYPVVFELDKMTRQKRKSFIENKIPFVVTDKQLYLPFMGVSLQESFDSEPSTMLNLKNCFRLRR